MPLGWLASWVSAAPQQHFRVAAATFKGLELLGWLGHPKFLPWMVLMAVKAARLWVADYPFLKE